MTSPVPAGAGGVDTDAAVEAAARFVALCRPLEAGLVDSAIYALANLQCDISNGDGYDPKEYREDAWAVVAAVVEHLAWSVVAAALAAAEQRADTLAAAIERVRATHPSWWERVCSETNEVCGRCRVRYPCPTVAALSSRPVPDMDGNHISIPEQQ